jgi:hypothetical protein
VLFANGRLRDLGRFSKPQDLVLGMTELLLAEAMEA